ncbi:protein kinase [Novymonas esmeraldas]|uniref:Protein kinase n=1 Tax=Novymonas esmeraldas TaxID=1808958 RepID=A0AAW0ES45_9TRYP
MQSDSDALLRESVHATYKRERSRSYSTESGSPTSPRLPRQRARPASPLQGGATAEGECGLDGTSGRAHADPDLFELVALATSATEGTPATRFGVEGLRIGRDPGCCDVVVPVNAVSRLHCVLSVLGDEVFVHDNSFNGTYINGRRVGRGRCSLLHPHDTLSFLNPTLEEAARCAYNFAPLPGLSSSGFGVVEGLRRYELGPVLGQGSFAAVRLGIDRETGAPVAIKLIERRRLCSDEAAASLHTEIEMMRSMDHPHVVRVVDAFEGDDCVALVLEYVRGGDLFDYVVGRGRNPFTEDEARHLFAQLLTATLYIHGRSIIHCDLKPENVLVDVVRRAPHGSGAAGDEAAGPLRSDGDAALSVVDNHQAEAKQLSPYDVRLKLTDFGIAKYDGGEAETTGAGTAVYAAPELARPRADGAPSQEITSAVDVWSLGVLLYILCSGTVPKHPSPGVPVAFNQSMALLSAPCKDLIARMMAADPAQRPPLAEVCHHPWLDGVAVDGAPDGDAADADDVLSITTRLSPRFPATVRPHEERRVSRPSPAESVAERALLPPP